MTLSDILQAKGSTVFTMHPDATLQEIIQEMVRRNVGAIVIRDRDLEGIGANALWGSSANATLSTSSAAGRGPLSGNPRQGGHVAAVVDRVARRHRRGTMGLMTDHRIRHLPVLAEGRLVGIVSIGDVVKSHTTAWRWRTSS